MTWTVHKFGGTSLADAKCFQQVANIVLSPDEIYDELECAYDLNFDNQATVQDIILLVDYIFESN